MEETMKVEFYSYDYRSDEDRKVGTITLKNGKFTADTPTAKRMLKTSVYTNKGAVNSESNPEAFMLWLQYQYKSYALRATEPK